MKLRKYIARILCLSAILLGGCTTDDLVDTSGDSDQTSFRIVCYAPGDMSVVGDSRAYSDGHTAQRLYYAIYQDEDNGEHTLIETNIEGTDVSIGNALTFSYAGDNERPKTALEATLTIGKRYTMVFVGTCEDSPYTLDAESATLTVDYSGEKCNDDRGDVFYRAISFKAVAGEVPDVITLTRPVAQLNVGTSNEDWSLAEDAGMTPTETRLIAKNVYATMNLFDGSVSNPVTAELAYASLPDGEVFPKLNDENTSDYHYMAMAYLLVNEQEKFTIQFGVNPSATFGSLLTVDNVPLERNHRTNIYGDLLYSQLNASNITVEIDPDFDLYNWSYGSYDGDPEILPGGKSNDDEFGLNYNYGYSWRARSQINDKEDLARWLYGGYKSSGSYIFGASSFYYYSYSPFYSYSNTDGYLYANIEVVGGETDYTHYTYTNSYDRSSRKYLYTLESTTEYYWYSGDIDSEIPDNALTFEGISDRRLYLQGYSITLKNASIPTNSTDGLTIVGPGLIESVSTDGKARCLFNLTSSMTLQIEGGEYRMTSTEASASSQLFKNTQGYILIKDGFFFANSLNGNTPIAPESNGLYCSGGVFTTTDVIMPVGYKKQTLNSVDFQSLYDTYINGDDVKYGDNKYVADGTESFYQVVEK